MQDRELVLSALSLQDAAAHLAGEDAELVRWLNGGVGTSVTVEAFIRRSLQHWERGGPILAFGIREDSVLAGTLEIQFEQAGLPEHAVNISYGLYPGFRGRGLASRAVCLACAYAGRLGATTAIIKVEPENLASLAVAVRSGFAEFDRLTEDGGTELVLFQKILGSAEPKQ
ncbi:hypothetical protein UM93_06665 [Psychromicrobium lacuslunae]|uniref:N-acetyltransferase domain-containing protein n=1 Tax=Psychromicrobium lacuslunae TaxID=1618207 RepID=A0A0D4C2M3_9MICC|nr:hypothetical protein UM93_06665 [Psychromicrobium lacuslunae]